MRRCVAENRAEVVWLNEGVCNATNIGNTTTRIEQCLGSLEYILLLGVLV